MGVVCVFGGDFCVVLVFLLFGFWVFFFKEEKILARTSS